MSSSIFTASALRRLCLGAGSKRPAHCVGGCVVDAVLYPIFEEELVSDECVERIIVNYIVAKSELHLPPCLSSNVCGIIPCGAASERVPQTVYRFRAPRLGKYVNTFEITSDSGSVIASMPKSSNAFAYAVRPGMLRAIRYNSVHPIKKVGSFEMGPFVKYCAPW